MLLQVAGAFNSFCESFMLAHGIFGPPLGCSVFPWVPHQGIGHLPWRRLGLAAEERGWTGWAWKPNVAGPLLDAPG